MAIGIFHKNPVPGLRKRYDRAREHADKLKDRNKKLQVLHLLDSIEPTLISLEEQNQPKFELKRMVNYVKNNVEEAEDLIKEKMPQMYEK